MTKKISQQSIEEMHFKIAKAVNNKSTVSVILNGGKLEVYSLRSRIRQGC